MARKTSRSRDDSRSFKNSKREIRVVDSSNRKNRPDRNQRDDRAKRKKLARERKFRRRRITLLLILIIIIFFIARFISNAMNTYNVLGYPEFREDVLEDLGNDVFISSSEGRSLSTAEKVVDFDNFVNIIERNYAVDKYNRSDFENFMNQSNDFRKRVYTSKTDQEYFNIIDQYLDVLNDTRTFILDKQTYDSLFNYYRNKTGDYRKDILENPQAVDRYKRLIQTASLAKPSMSYSIENGHILRISLADFKPDEYEKDIKTINQVLLSNPPMTTFIIDLSNNNSIDYIYRNRLLEMLIHQNFSESNIVFYRGKLFGDMLDSLKENENPNYSSPFVKNDASKTTAETEAINIDDYMYFDELSLKIDKDLDYSDRNIYVLTNSKTANEAIKMADILKANGAYIVKNGLESNPTYKDVIYNAPSALYVMEHSGLILSLNGAYAKKYDDDIYLHYDERINSKDPISSMKAIIN